MGKRIKNIRGEGGGIHPQGQTGIKRLEIWRAKRSLNYNMNIPGHVLLLGDEPMSGMPFSLGLLKKVT